MSAVLRRSVAVLNTWRRWAHDVRVCRWRGERLAKQVSGCKRCCWWVQHVVLVV